MRAFGDESLVLEVRPRGTAYILGAVVLSEQAVVQAREAVEDLKLPGQRRIHWHEEGHSRREVLASGLGSIDAIHVVSLCRGPEGIRQERLRRLALVRLLTELGLMGVESLTLESRGARADARDRALGRVLRDGWSGSREAWLTHENWRSEPLLWAPDVLCGSFAASLRGSQDHLAHIQRTLTVIEAAM